MIILLILGAVLIYTFCFGVKRIPLHTKERNTYLLLFLLLLLLNSISAYGRIQVESSHNYSTYVTYQLTLDQLQRIDHFTITELSDIRQLKDIIEGLSNQTGLLVYQLEHTKLAKENNEQLLSILSRLTDELQAFAVYHNRLFAEGGEISSSEFSHYKPLVTELSQFYAVLSNSSSSHGGRLGVSQYKLNLEDWQLEQLGKSMKAISEITSSIIS